MLNTHYLLSSLFAAQINGLVHWLWLRQNVKIYEVPPAGQPVDVWPMSFQLVYCTYMHTYTHTYIHTCMHTHIHTHIYAHTHTHTHTQARTHTHTHTYMHTYITLQPSLCYSLMTNTSCELGHVIETSTWVLILLSEYQILSEHSLNIKQYNSTV